jgi:hypothetical protein
VVAYHIIRAQSLLEKTSFAFELVDQATAVAKTASAAPEVMVAIRSSPSEDGRRFDVTLETSEGYAQGTLELTAEHITALVPS